MTPSPYSKTTLELAFALFIALFGGYIIIGALEMKVGWSGASPESGYFPFRVGILIVGCAGLIALKAILENEKVTFSLNIKRITLFYLPLVALVIAIPYLGFYVAAFLYLAFMLWQARLSVPKIAAISLLTPLILFFAFEKIFKTPLPLGWLKYIGVV